MEDDQGNCGGGSGACIDPVFGPTAADIYWSATALASRPNDACVVLFSNGGVGTVHQFNGAHVRAVRTGS